MSTDPIRHRTLLRVVAGGAGVTLLAILLISSVPGLVGASAAATDRKGVETAGATELRASDIDASTFVQRLGDRVVVLMREDAAFSRPEHRERLRALLIESTDLGAVSRSALGRYWRLANDTQRVRYGALYPEYLLATYDGLLRQYSGGTFSVTRSQPLNDRETLVEGRIERPDGAPIVLAFRVRKADDGFKLLDVLVERVSLLVTQRSEFASVIRNEGMEGLLAHLEKAARQPMSGQRE